MGLAKQAINSASGNIIATGSTKDGEKSFEFTGNATDWQKNTENQIKNVSKKQLSNVGREEGGEGPEEKEWRGRSRGRSWGVLILKVPKRW